MLAVCDIISNEKITENHRIYRLVIDAPKIAGEAKPGQFVNIKCKDFTLRRPISIAGAENGRITICYDVRGAGTSWLSEQKSGKIDILGPLGSGFDISDTSKKVLLAGGGVGIFPLYPVAAAYRENAYAVLGFRTAGLAVYEKEFKSLGCEVHIATDDGSYGKKGFATDIVREILENKENKIKIIMTCGPKAMMRGVALEAAKKNIKCQASFEERMACGVGACLACVCKINGESKRICCDGPVFDITGITGEGEIEWE